MTHSKSKEGGYIAIITSILISLVLLALVAENGFLGWHARFVALSREKKQQADALAQGCITAALSSVLKNPSFSSSTIAFPNGTCAVRLTDATNQHAVQFEIQAQSGSPDTGGIAYTNMKVIADFANIHLGTSPLSTGASPSVLSVTITSEQEVPSE